jgi:hypothetical protein
MKKFPYKTLKLQKYTSVCSKETSQHYPTFKKLNSIPPEVLTPTTPSRKTASKPIVVIITFKVPTRKNYHFNKLTVK